MITELEFKTIVIEWTNDYTLDVICFSDKIGAFNRSFKGIKASNILEAKSAVETLLDINENVVFLEDNRYNGNTLVMAKILPQTNVGRFIEHINSDNVGNRWVKGYIIAEASDVITLLVGGRFEVLCKKDEVIIMKSNVC